MIVAEPPRQAGQVVNSRLIMPFVTSVRSVFATMVKVPTTVGRPALKTTPGATYDVSSMVGFHGTVTGCMVVRLQTRAAEQLASAFTGTPLTTVDPDFADALGELANMIAGSAKKDFGHGATISIPSVIIGTGHVIACPREVPCIVIPCQTPLGDFAVEVSIEPMTHAAGGEPSILSENRR